MRTAFLFVILLFAFDCFAQQNTAGFTGSCRSLQLGIANCSDPTYGPMSYCFTTPDARANTYPLSQDLGNGTVEFSGEVRPRVGPSGSYETDYAAYNSVYVSVEYGSLILNLPTTDADNNGLPDLLQLNQPVNATINGSAVMDWPSPGSAGVSGTFVRSANQRMGNYSLVFANDGATMSGTWRISAIVGTISYARGPINTLSLNVTSDIGSYTGNTTFVVNNANQIVLPQFNLFTGDTSVFTVRAGTTFNRVGQRYVAEATLYDGIRETEWPDFIHWAFEILDTNDLDGNGIPDLSDAPAGAPAINAQPQSQSVNAGSGVSFNVNATGAPSLSYQWQLNGIQISGATTSSFTISSAQAGDAGSYVVRVYNSQGVVSSSPATLVVNVAPTIISQPCGQAATLGANVTLTVGAVGTPVPGYQWRFNGTNIAGATSSWLPVIGVQSNMLGNYTVVVANPLGSVTSLVATLSLLPPQNVNGCMPAPAGKIGWWPGDGAANDIQGSYHGALQNGTRFTAGEVGQAFSFDGVTNMMKVGAVFPAVSNTFTMECWVNPAASRDSTIEATQGTAGLTGQRYAIFPRHGASSYGAGHAGAGISVGTNGISVFEHSDGYLTSLLVYNTPIKGWTHVAVVYQNKQPRLYLNGVLMRTGLTSSFIVHPSGDMGGPYGFFSGAIDEVGVYGRSLTGAEVQSIYNAGSAGLCKGAGFSSVSQMNGRQIQLKLGGRTGSNFRIEASTNLSDWVSLVVLTNQLGTVQFIDSSTTNLPKRFYRAIPLP
jgi:hypothetical protein